MGLKYVAWAEMATEPTSSIPTYSAGLAIGKAVSSNLAITNAEGELYADDALAEYVSEFANAALTMEVDNIALANQAKLYGATYSGDEFMAEAADTAPYGGIGGYQILIINNVKKYRAWFFPKAKASVPDWGATTKGNSISFGTQPIKMRIMKPNYGPWYYMKEFTTEAAAQAYIDAKLGVTTWHEINVQVNNPSTGKSGSPAGITYVPNAGTFTLTIAGTAAALYDNGVESKASIVDGAYVLSNVTAAHKIALIF